MRSIEKKVGYAAIFADTTRRGALPAAVFADTTRRGALPEEASIHIVKMSAIKIALKEIHKKEDKRCVIYTDS